MKTSLLDLNTPRLGAADVNAMANNPGIYAFWMRTGTATSLGINLCSALEKSGYSLVYIGIAKSMKKRQLWHWVTPFRDGSVIHGTISTLNQTLAALLGKPYVAENEIEIKQLMNNEMFVEVTYTDNIDQALQLESDLLQKLSCPLNIAKNSDHPFCKILKSKRTDIRNVSISIAKARRKK